MDEDKIKLEDLDLLNNVPQSAELYVTANGQDYRTTKEKFLEGLAISDNLIQWEEVSGEIQNKLGKPVVVKNKSENDQDYIFFIKKSNGDISVQVAANGTLETINNIQAARFDTEGGFGSPNGQVQLLIDALYAGFKSNKRINYETDLSSTFTARSLVDKAYADSKVPLSGTTAANPITGKLDYETDLSATFTDRSLVDKGYVDTKQELINGTANVIPKFGTGGLISSNIVDDQSFISLNSKSRINFTGGFTNVFEVFANGISRAKVDTNGNFTAGNIGPDVPFVIRTGSIQFQSAGGFGKISLGSVNTYLFLGNNSNSNIGINVNFSNGHLLVNTTTDNGINALQVNGSVKATSSIQVGDNTAAASASNVGAIRYRATSTNSFMEMSMQTGASAFAWVIIKQNTF
jgi:hypothetical protein